MFSERLQKMRDATGTSYVEGEGRGSAVRARARRVSPFSRDAPASATVASSACPVHDGTSSGRGSDRELTCVTWRARRGELPAMIAGDAPSLSPRSAAPPEEKHAPRAREASRHRRDRRRRADASGGRSRGSRRGRDGGRVRARGVRVCGARGQCAGRCKSGAAPQRERRARQGAERPPRARHIPLLGSHETPLKCCDGRKTRVTSRATEG